MRVLLPGKFLGQDIIKALNIAARRLNMNLMHGIEYVPGADAARINLVLGARVRFGVFSKPVRFSFSSAIGSLDSQEGYASISCTVRVLPSWRDKLLRWVLPRTDKADSDCVVSADDPRYGKVGPVAEQLIEVFFEELSSLKANV